MKINIRTITIQLFIFSIITMSCGKSGNKKEMQSDADTSGVILINQIGYPASASKIALIRGDAETFKVIDVNSGKTVLKGPASEPEYWPFSGDTVRRADFSSLNVPGTYRLCINKNRTCSYDFIIGDDVYHELVKASVKSFYFNRSGCEITKEYGSKWARPAGHPDTVVLMHASAASASRPAGTVISSPGGWYDAGDYNKYIVNSGITTWTLLLFYQLYPEYCSNLELNIPESNNDIPDVVDELLYNLRWMLTMQDPADGGVYHKLTNKEFGGFEMPDKAREPRYVVQKSTAAALNFAAVTAMASRVFAGNPVQELRELSAKCLAAATRAMKWAEAHPDVIYRQPADVKTGEYGDRSLDDDWFWAKTEMALAVNDPSKTDAGNIGQISLFTPAWNQVEMLGIISLALTDNETFNELQSASESRLIAFADTLLRKYEESAYRVSLDYFKWGSNSDVVNQAMLKLLALKLTGDKKYLPSIQGDVDYILGRNATSYSFVTGYGSKPPMNIHHRPSGADGVPEPVPGFLAGGPNTSVMNDCGDNVIRSTFPAKSYADTECSYSTNEIAINWNAPLFFVMGAMDAVTAKFQR
jgi:endoglucanase